MARQGWSLSEREIRRIGSLLSETDLLVGSPCPLPTLMGKAFKCCPFDAEAS